MSRFVFRAQAALELRRKRHDEAQRAAAAADLALQMARQALEAADRDLREGVARADAAEAHADTGTRIWYRNWLITKRQEIAARSSAVAEREAAARQTRAQAMRAHRDLKAIERLRERAWRAHAAAEGRAEQKALDWLGTLQHARRAGRIES